MIIDVKGLLEVTALLFPNKEVFMPFFSRIL